jgi:uncharacterized protein (DUF427 family)
MWEYYGQKRPPFALEPQEGQESVWDYPRPPAVRSFEGLVEVKWKGNIIARSERACRVMETASPPGYYIPPDDTASKWLQPAPERSFCEWKGEAGYWSLIGEFQGEPVGWSYPGPNAGYLMLAGYISFYPARIECYVNGERVRPQPGEFYGGWITDSVVGPFKGEPGTENW